MLNCFLNLVASLDGENELPLKVIALFSASCFALPSFNSFPQLGQVCLLVHGFNNVSQFNRLCTQMRLWMSLFNLGSSCKVGLFYGCHLACSSRPVSLLVMFLMESVTYSRDVM